MRASGARWVETRLAARAPHATLAARGAPAYDARMGRPAHPTAQQLEGLVFRRLDEDEARRVASHARDCPACRARVERDVRLRRRLQLLRADEPRVDIVDAIVRRTSSRDGRTATTGEAKDT
jgi:hypothetical protein